MRKRSKYRPRPVLANPVAYVVESVTPVTKNGSYLLELQIKNHGALASLTQGKATFDDLNTILAMANMTEALHKLGKGSEYGDLVQRGRNTLIEVVTRGAQRGTYTLRAEEMRTLNELMELHDAQLEICTVKDIERGINLVRTSPTKTRLPLPKEHHEPTPTTARPLRHRSKTDSHRNPHLQDHGGTEP